MTSKEIRQSFLDFFESKKHVIVPSASIVLDGDPTLMFTNAGMNQFKDIFLGKKEPEHKRVANSQKCLRVSGKHNDLDEVGHDTYHHTMFEMLGCWSFNDYFKEEIIEWSWEYLTKVLKLDKDRLYATVFEGDDKDCLGTDLLSRRVWSQYLPKDHIVYGNKHDNFWDMGSTGPCGPCSEIHIDLRNDEERKKIPGKDLVNKNHPQVIEIWNLVFMQYNRLEDGSLELLPEQHVDTGMGFERLCMVLQDKTSSYDTDIFQPIIGEIEKLSKLQYGYDKDTDIAIRVVADHIRAVSFAIADGQLPSNVKSGYVIRRILRRAVRYANTYLNQTDAFLYKLVPVLIKSMGDTYPELKEKKDLIETVIKKEEISFLKTLRTGMRLLDKVISKMNDSNHNIGGDIVFKLYDTFGFPKDLTELILKERGFSYNEDEYNKCLQEQRERSRK